MSGCGLRAKFPRGFIPAFVSAQDARLGGCSRVGAQGTASARGSGVVQCWGAGALQRGMSHVDTWQRGFGSAVAILVVRCVGDLPLQIELCPVEVERWRGQYLAGPCLFKMRKLLIVLVSRLV